jgi:hypothetical protein
MRTATGNTQPTLYTHTRAAPNTKPDFGKRNIDFRFFAETTHRRRSDTATREQLLEKAFN